MGLNSTRICFIKKPFRLTTSASNGSCFMFMLTDFQLFRPPVYLGRKDGTFMLKILAYDGANVSLQERVLCRL